MATTESRQRAAQAWRTPKTSDKVMDIELAEAFADILDGPQAAVNMLADPEVEKRRVSLASALLAEFGGYPGVAALVKKHYGLPNAEVLVKVLEIIGG